MSAQGYAINDTAKWSDFELVDFPLKSQGPKDVTIAIEHCGVCGSDVHTLTGGWGAVTYPCVVGHEIIGRVTQLGEEASGEFKVGDLVGVGAQVCSCTSCQDCKADNEQYCSKGSVFTYQGTYPNGDRSQGGYSTAVRAHENFVFKIPDNLEGKYAAPLMCAGLTVFSPLKRNGCGPGKKVGIVGIGGLGHIAVMFAKAMGAEVFALTHSLKKKEDILKMGADHIIVTGEDDFETKHFRELDLILTTVDKVEGLPFGKLCKVLKVGGRLITVGLPDGNANLGITSQTFMMNQCLFGSSLLGSKAEANEMLAIAAKHQIKPWIQELPMSRAKEAVESLWNGTVRYRYVLHNDIPKKE